MKPVTGIAAILACLGLLVTSCGDNRQPATQNLDPASLLPKSAGDGSPVRSTDVETFVGQSLYEHINGGAELYHTYGFIDVATAYYLENDVEVLSDVFHFDTPEHAYGLYSSLRPPEATLVPQGIEGFATGSTIEFVKGDCLVRLTGYDESIATSHMLQELAEAIESITPGTTAKPETFAMFPTIGRVPMTDRIWSAAFLGQQALTDVYAQKYTIDTDTLTLFLTVDGDGAKLAALTRIEGAIENPEEAAALPYDAERSVLIEHSSDGHVMGGARGDLLLGVVNYSDRHQQFLADWINGMK